MTLARIIHLADIGENLLLMHDEAMTRQIDSLEMEHQGFGQLFGCNAGDIG